MTRSHKANDRDHAGLANGTAAPEEHLPRYFAKSGFTDVDPKKVKKEGGGKGNWYGPLIIRLRAIKYTFRGDLASNDEGIWLLFSP